MLSLRKSIGKWVGFSRPQKTTYTILILPNARSRFRKLHVSRGFVLSLLGVAAAIVLSAMIMPHYLFRSQAQSAEIARLEHEREQLLAQSHSFQDSLDAVAEQLDIAENRTRLLSQALGVESDSPPAAGGAGNGVVSRSPLASAFGELDLLRQRSDDLGLSLSRLDELFQGRISRLASTPLGRPTEGWFSHGFGWRKDPFTGNRQFHRGIDIVNHQGTPIKATADGVISRAIRVSDYGKTVDVSHELGFVTRYAHMSEILVRPGQKVLRGDVIGRVGSTGRSTGPHLHYEVFRDGRRVNPWKYLDLGSR